MALKANFYGDLLRKDHIFRMLAVLCYARLSLYAKRENEQKWAISETFNCHADKQDLIIFKIWSHFWNQRIKMHQENTSAYLDERKNAGGVTLLISTICRVLTRAHLAHSWRYRGARISRVFWRRASFPVFLKDFCIFLMCYHGVLYQLSCNLFFGLLL